MLDPDICQQTWDVLIVGAGPAGGAAAICCSRLGLGVLLVDAKRFPRRKVCGGCLNQVSIQRLEQLLGPRHPLVENALPLTQFELRHRQRHFTFPLPLGRAIERSQLDQALVEAAQQAGATFMPGVTARVMPADQAARGVELFAEGQRVQVRSRIVLLASGLGSRAAGELQELQGCPHPASRLGIEAILEDFPATYRPGAIHMVVARDGYVGLTHLSGQRLHVAAAVDRPPLQQFGPAALTRRILAEAGAPQLATDSGVTWRGTPPLSARPPRLAAQRIFLIGDAAGYVEPFTGEGIRWALESGMGVAELTARAAVDWRQQHIAEWETWYRDQILTEQRMCRWLASGLKRLPLRWLSHQLLRLNPRLASLIISRLNSERN